MQDKINFSPISQVFLLKKQNTFFLHKALHVLAYENPIIRLFLMREIY